jgi:8-oxo-dGTP diphosphatase
MSREGTERTPAADSPLPRVREGVKALVAVGGRVLLVQERHADGQRFWTLPGGGLEPGEPPVAGLKRELREELYCPVAVGDRVAEFWYAHVRPGLALSRYAVFDCRALGQVVPSTQEGVLDYQWSRPSDPPARTVPQVGRLLARVG